MELILAMSVAKIFDPIFFVFAFGAVYWLRSWWGVLVVGLVLAFVYQIFLSDSRVYAFVAAYIAMTLQAWFSYGIYHKLGTSRKIQLS